MAKDSDSKSTLDEARKIFHGYLSDEVNYALRIGGLYSAGLGFVGGVAIVGLTAWGAVSGLEGPLVITVIATCYSYLIHLLGKHGKLRGAVVYITFLPFVTIPSFFFIATHFYMPSGAGTFIHGPFAFVNMHLVVMTGFLFNMRLSTIAGIIVGGVYVIAAYLATQRLPDVMTIRDPLLEQEMYSFPIYLIRGFIIASAGPVVGALSTRARRLIEKVLQGEREKDSISRLFGQYVSPEVKDRILADSHSRIGERKRVVILFSDLVGFTTLSEQETPDEVVLRLNEYFDRMVATIGRFGGTVDKFIGDAIMALFDGVLDVENPEDSAVRAALAMNTELVSLNEKWNETGHTIRFGQGVGIHVGEVLLGSIGSERRKDFTVVGDPVNTAARLEGLTREHGCPVVFSEEIYRSMSSELQSQAIALGPVKLKGKSTQVIAYGIG